MTKKNLIALADVIREHQRCYSHEPFTRGQLDTLARFCRSQNLAFLGGRWLGYIAGENGPNGGKVKKPKPKAKGGRDETNS